MHGSRREVFRMPDLVPGLPDSIPRMADLMATLAPAPRSGAEREDVPPPDVPATDLPTALLRLADADADALADRLHDGVLQALVVARYAADAAVRGGDPRLTRDAVQDALVTLRRTVWLLRPRTADGLAAALSQLAVQREAAGRPGLDLHVEPEPAGRLGPDAASLAYRLVQAVLDGAGAEPVRVGLALAGRLAALDVDRPVRDPAAWSLRAQALGGVLVASPGRLRLLLPLCPPSHDDRKAAP